MLKKHLPGFDPWAFALLVLIMLPNIIWFAQLDDPPVVLQAQDILPAVDAAASVTRVLMIVCLCFLKNAEAPSLRPRPLTIVCAACVLAYYVMWALYFQGISIYPFKLASVIWGLCLFPCASFILFSLDRKNLPALAFALVFTVCHCWCTGACLRAVWGF